MFPSALPTYTTRSATADVAETPPPVVKAHRCFPVAASKAYTFLS